MKKITLSLFAICIGAIGFSQEFPLDFSDPNDVFDDGANPASSSTIVTDPNGCASAGCSGDVLEINGGGEQFSDPVQLNLVNYRDLTDSNNNTITLEFYASRAGNMLFQFSNAADNSFPVEINSAVVPGLNSLSLDFDNATNGFPNQNDPVNLNEYATVSIFVDFGEAGVVATHWVDNIAGGLQGNTVQTTQPNPPTSLAPIPPARATSSVTNLYGDGYPDEIGLNNVSFDDPTVFAEANEGGGDVLQINFVGPFMGSDLGTVQNTANLSHFHMDYWVSDDIPSGETRTFNIKLSNHNPNGGGGESNAIELPITLNDGDELQWVSIDVPFTDFADATPSSTFKDREFITQFLITSDTDVVYIDNLYFHDDTTLGIDSTEELSFKIFPNPSNGAWNVISKDQAISNIQLFDITGKQILDLNPDAINANIDGSNLNAGIYLARITANGSTNTVKLIKN